MISQEQQTWLRRDLLRQMATTHSYQQLRLEVRFKHELKAVAQELKLPEAEIETIVARSGLEVFCDYALGDAGGGVGVYALIRTYYAVQSPLQVDAMQRRIQSLTSTPVAGESSSARGA